MESLVSTQWLAEQIGKSDLVLIDATRHLPVAGRNALDEYRERHVPGARFLDLTQLVDSSSEVPSAMPRPGQLAGALATLGVSPQMRVVFYDDSAVKTAARAWYLCRAHGLNNVAILDGGLAKWMEEERPLESGEARVDPADPFTLPSPADIRFKVDMLANLETLSEQVIDARGADRFAGMGEDPVHPGQPTGHIPGSCNLPFARLFNEDGTYKSPEQIRELFQSTGIDLSQPIISSCGSGVTACVLLFALHLVGAPHTALYDGSWLDWASDPETPKATISL